MMDDRKPLKKLQELSQLIFDSRAQRLREANAKREALRAQLANIEPKPAESGLLWLASEQSLYDYEQWAVTKRAAINLQLAAQTAVCLRAEEDLRLAFGRRQALDALASDRRKRR